MGRTEAVHFDSNFSTELPMFTLPRSFKLSPNCFTSSARQACETAWAKALSEWPCVGASGTGYSTLALNETVRAKLESQYFKVSDGNSCCRIGWESAEIAADSIHVTHRIKLRGTKLEKAFRIGGFSLSSICEPLEKLAAEGRLPAWMSNERCREWWATFRKLFRQPGSPETISLVPKLYLLRNHYLGEVRERLPALGLSLDDIDFHWQAILSHAEYCSLQ